MQSVSVSTLLAKRLKSHVKDIFMLTGYGAMYLNDAIQREGINYYVSRNEAAAPMMAEAYAREKGGIGAVCVTAGPGATNAIPGLAEAYVDSAPVLILSGQVQKKFTTDKYKNYKIRSFGVAEFSISEAIKKFTKYSATISNPYDCLYELDKAIHFATSGRPGPVWLEIPLDIQSFEIKNKNKIRKFKSIKKKYKNNKIKKLANYFNKSKNPIFVIGNGIKQSKTKNNFLKLVKKHSVPFFTSRFAYDLFPFSNKYNLGLLGIKGQPYSREILDKTDLLIFLGCRAAPTVYLDKVKKNKKLKKVIIDIDTQSLNHPLTNFNLKINYDLKDFFKVFTRENKNKISFKSWNNFCQKIKNKNEIKLIKNKKDPIDLYRFMFDLNKLSRKNSIFTNDAGSNYYVGGQVWRFENKQTEIASTTNAAMGLSVPLSIGAAVANPKKQVISVTGDGSIELNIQELKTISHYKFNIKTFVINNGGYASMKNWQDNIFSGNRLDTEEKTGVGTLNFKKIAEAFGLEFILIDKTKDIKKKIKQVTSNKKPYLVEVVTNSNQTLLGTEP
jgi:acetolactate synthase-1/2/3 large subunit